MPRVRVTVPFTDNESGSVRLIGHAFDCGEERAAELAALGLVEPADGAQEWPPASGNLVDGLMGGEPEGEEVEDGQEAAQADGEPTRAQLMERCEELGIEYPAKANKAKLKQLIEQAEAGE